MDFTLLVALLLGIRVAISDLYARRVPNLWLGSALGMSAAWMLLVWLRGQAEFPLAALLGLVAGLVVLMPFYLVRWMGAGDVKYFATIGFLLGWQALLPVWIVASLLAGGHAVAVLFAGGMLNRVPALQMASRRLCIHFENRTWWHRLQSARAGRRGIPYAAYLAVGTFVWIFQTVARSAS